jgi:hypothetical protein
MSVTAWTENTQCSIPAADEPLIMRIVLASVTPANDLSERLAERFALPLPHAREWAAKILGYPQWEALREQCHRLGGRLDLSAPDSHCASLAVRWRRAYQAERLAALAKIELSDALRLIEELRPSDGFEFEGTFDGRAPRRADPTLAIDEHRDLVAAFATLWRIGGRESPIDRTLRAVLVSLEALLIKEYPIEQYPYDATRAPYRTASLIDLPQRAPKRLSAEKHQECIASIATIRRALARNWPPDLTEAVADIVATLGRAQDQIEAWRRASAARDGEAIAWRGVTPEEEEILDALAAVVLPEQVSLLKTSGGFAALSDDEAGLMLAHLRVTGVDRTRPALRPGIRRLEAIVRGGERDERRRWERKTPVNSIWIIVAVQEGERTLIGKVQATSSAEALARAGIASDRRLIATTATVAERILGSSPAALGALLTLA